MTESPKSSKTPKRNGSWWRKNWFYTVLIAVALLGGLSAFWIPFRLPQPFSKGDSISTLRQSILAATGGILAILTLWENRRKNIQEKEKNDQDHTRQVHAERRARYAKAIEQLADEKAPIRLGGIYTLVKLVDEWLADEKTLPNEEERREEGQVIINSLCAYIRSPFDLVLKAEVLSQDKTPESYEGGDQQFVKDQARFREEQEIRHIILSEIKKRLNGDKVKNKEITPGTWSYFEYNFSDAHFFYAVNFNNSYFDASLNFLGATFTGYANFSEATFTGEASFIMATFTGYANFSGATFTQNADFYKAKFTEYADFTEAEFTRSNFYKAKFTGYADFTEAEFTQSADFYEVKFTGYADFTGAKFTRSNFSGAEFTDANFFGVKFTRSNFSGAEFAQDADFSGAEFAQDADFSGAEFTGYTHFTEAAFQTEPIFGSVPGNEARFSCKVDPENYDFEVSSESPYKIDIWKPKHNGFEFTIPKGAILFDPDEPPELDDNDDS